MPRRFISIAAIFLTMAALGCQPARGPEIAHGEYSRSSAHLAVSGSDTTVKGDDDMVSGFPSALTIGDAHNYTADIGTSRLVGKYLVRHDTLVFYGNEGSPSWSAW